MRPYEQERHGESVPISGYWRHHAPSSPGSESDSGPSTDDDQNQDDAEFLLTGKGPQSGKGPWSSDDEAVQYARKIVEDAMKAGEDVKEAAVRAKKYLLEVAEEVEKEIEKAVSPKAKRKLPGRLKILKGAAKVSVDRVFKLGPLLIVPLPPNLQQIINPSNPQVI